MRNEETIIKIKTSDVLATKWADRAKSLGVSRSDYLNNLLLSRDSFPLVMATTSNEQSFGSVDGGTTPPRAR